MVLRKPTPKQQRARKLVVRRAGWRGALRRRTISKIQKCRETAWLDLPIAAGRRTFTRVGMDLRAAATGEAPAAAKAAEVLGLHQHQVVCAGQEEVDLRRVTFPVYCGERSIQVGQPLAAEGVAPEERLQRVLLSFERGGAPHWRQAEEPCERKARPGQRVDQVPQQGVLGGGSAQIIEHGLRQNAKDRLHRSVEYAGYMSRTLGQCPLESFRRCRRSLSCRPGAMSVELSIIGCAEPA